MMQNFEVIYDKFNAVGVCTSRNYKQKWITTLHNYYFTVPASISIWTEAFKKKVGIINLKIMGIRNWHAVAKDRQEWRKTVLEAEVHNRL
jgi:hypothetical protein